MSIQTAANTLVAISRESITGTAATATGATELRILDSPGLELKRADIVSAEKRDDGYESMGRNGGKTVDGSYNAELTAGGATDIIVEAVGRSTWSAAVPTTFVSMTTVTVASNTLTAGGGVWDTQSIRTGDIITLSGTSQSLNNNLRTPVVSVTTLVITVPTGSYTAVSSATTGTVTRLKKLVAATTPTRYTHTLEQNDQDADCSEVFVGCRVVSVKLSGKPNSFVQMTYTFMGMDRQQKTTSAAPYFTTPTLTTNTGMIADDCTIRWNGSNITTFTSFDLEFQITAAGQPVIGSFVSPDIFDNTCKITGQIMGLRSDFSNLVLFDAETEVELLILMQELATAPKPCLSIFLPRVNIKSLSAPAGGGNGAKIETLGLRVGPKVATTGYDGTPYLIASSAA